MTETGYRRGIEISAGDRNASENATPRRITALLRLARGWFSDE